MLTAVIAGALLYYASLQTFPEFRDPQVHLVQTQPDSEMDQLFASTDGWVGADGVYSVDLDDGRVIWLFSDTWVGKVRDGKRVDCTMVNNTLAIQTGPVESPQIEFVVRKDESGKPTAFIVPADGQGFFWLQGATSVNGRLYLFLNQTITTPGGGAFGFRQTGVWLGIVENPGDHPLDWKVTQKKIPFAEFEEGGPERPLGNAILQAEGYLYVYGLNIAGRSLESVRDMIVGRVPLDAIDDFSQWRFSRDGDWQDSAENLTGFVPEMASESSVTFMPALGKYVLTYSKRGFLKQIFIRTADNPWGPWSSPITVYECPEFNWKRKVFTYAAKARPVPGQDQELQIVYASNSMDFATVANDASLYFPRFIRVKLAPGGKPRQTPAD